MRCSRLIATTPCSASGDRRNMPSSTEGLLASPRQYLERSVQLSRQSPGLRWSGSSRMTLLHRARSPSGQGGVAKAYDSLSKVSGEERDSSPFRSLWDGSQPKRVFGGGP